MALRRREQAVLAAFAAALIPGNPLPAARADDGIEIVPPVRDLLEQVSPRSRLAVRLALNLFELTSFPRRFSRLALAGRSAHLQRMDGARGGLRRELYLLLKTLCTLAYARNAQVQAAVGVRLRCETADRGLAREAAASASFTPPPPLDRAAMVVEPGVEECEVVIVGSGAGGAAAARVLAEAGLSVVVLEEGDYHDADSYSTDPFEALPMLYRDAGLTFCEGRPAIPMPLGRCVGGTTVINSGTCLRTPADVLARWRDERGIAWAPDLDAEFETLERDLHVAPVDPRRAGRNAQLCRQGAERLGVSNGPLARNAGQVAVCGTCPTGCALDAKMAMHVSELPRAVAAGARVRAGVRVDRVLVAKGRAVGVSVSLPGGATYEARARAVVMAGGAIGTPELLLSQGLAGSSGRLGRGLHVHPACWVGGRFDDEVRGWEGIMQSWHVDEWAERGLFLEATFTPFPFAAHWLPGAGSELMRRIADYGRLAVIGVHVSERSSAGRVRVRGGRARVGYRLSAGDAQTIRFGIARAAELMFAAGAAEVYPQVAGLPVLRSAGEADRVEQGRLRPIDLRLEAFHPMGTAAMGSDPGRSVASPAGECHDLPGLYVVDASILPTSLGVNPMITIMACARKIARGIGANVA